MLCCSRWSWVTGCVAFIRWKWCLCLWTVSRYSCSRKWNCLSFTRFWNATREDAAWLSCSWPGAIHHPQWEGKRYSFLFLRFIWVYTCGFWFSGSCLMFSVIVGCPFLVFVGCMIIVCFSFLAGLESVPSGFPMVISAAQCVMLARCAARSERTETMNANNTFAKRKFYFCNSILSTVCCTVFLFSLWLLIRHSVVLVGVQFLMLGIICLLLEDCRVSNSRSCRGYLKRRKLIPAASWTLLKCGSKNNWLGRGKSQAAVWTSCPDQDYV